MHYTNRLRRACGVSLTAGLVVAGLAHAATPAASTTPEVGRLTVTGHPLQPFALENATPVLTIDHADIEATGLKTVEEVLARLTIAGAATNATANFRGTGETNVALRNLGSERVLVLVNGHRWMTSLKGDVDLSTIPLAIIDHIEIYKGGHSARFGSGAITGVINLVTRRNFSGVEASAHYGEYVEGGHHDGTTEAYSFTIGTGSDRGHVVLNGSYFNQEPVFAGDRAISAVPRYGTGTTRGSSTTSQGRFIVRNPNTGEIMDLTVKSGQPGTSLADFRPFNPITDHYNYQLANYLLAPSQRTGLFAQGSYQLLPNVRFYSTMAYDNRVSHHRFGPSEIDIGADTAFPISISASNPYNPFGYDLTASGPNATLLSFSRQLTESKARYFSEDVDTYYFTGGFSGHLPGKLGSIGWDVNYVFNKSQFNSLRNHLINTNKLAQALGPASDCPGGADPDCVPLNVFGGQYNGGTITPAMLDYISYTGHHSMLSHLREYNARLSGPIVDLPAGALSFEVGYQHRDIDGADVPGGVTAAGNSFGDFGEPASGGYSVNAEYVGLDVPLLAELPLVRKLELNLEARHASFDTFGTVNAGRAGLRWQPTDDWLVRAHWSKDFRTPTIREMFGGKSVGAAAITDPCSNYTATTTPSGVAAACAAAGVPASYVQSESRIRTISGANPALEPETGKSEGFGVVFSPSAVPALIVSIDFWKIEVDNRVMQLDPEQLLLGCYGAGEASFCADIDRSGAGAIATVHNLRTNIGSVVTDGIDAGVSYVFQPTAFGQFSVDWRTTYLHEFTETLTGYGASGAKPIVTERSGQEFGRIAGFPLFRSNLNVNWTLGRWSVDWLVRYLSDMSEKCSDRYDGTPLSLTNLGLCAYPDLENNSLSRNKLGATTYHDVQVSYDFLPANLRLTFGVRNVFDKQPPVSMTASSSFDTNLYPIPGRFPYVSVEARF
ncbi:MAG TPA: TonB-dependent receptor [Gammaproteobacteria bacterium]|nr:TonB-dependent receptor [Gammaproteobacteria bacterium]